MFLSCKYANQRNKRPHILRANKPLVGTIFKIPIQSSWHNVKYHYTSKTVTKMSPFILSQSGKTPEKPSFAVNELLNEKVSLWQGDITSLEIDAIVNAGKAYWYVQRRFCQHQNFLDVWITKFSYSRCSAACTRFVTTRAPLLICMHRRHFLEGIKQIT